MSPARFSLLIGVVLAAAALTIWIARLVAPSIAASPGWALVPLLAAGVALAFRRRS